MYAKTLVPGPPVDIPSLMSTTDDPDVLLPQLRALGWGRFGGPVPPAPAGQLVISPDRLQLVVDGQAVLDDSQWLTSRLARSRGGPGRSSANRVA